MQKHALIAADSIRIPKIHAIGYSDDRNITKFGPSVRNCYIIHYVLSGKGYFNGRTVEKGEGFLITPGLYEEYFSDERDPWGFIWIISEDEAMEYFFEGHNADKESGIFKFHNIYELISISRELEKVYNKLSSSVKLSEMFMRIYNSCIEGEGRESASVGKSYFDFSVNYIKTNLHQNIRVEDICRAIGISQPYLYRIFKENLGLSPKRYLTEQRIIKAKNLLGTGYLSVSQVGNALGFASVMDFSKFFSKEVGISPSDYRKG